MSAKEEPDVFHHRILWFWCPGHQRYEIAAVERHIGSFAFEQRCFDHWGSDVPYRITSENTGDENYPGQQIWVHDD